MSVNGGLRQVAHHWAAWPQRLRTNAASCRAPFGRKPRFTATPAWRSPRRLGVVSAMVVVAIAATMILVDAWAVGVVQMGQPEVPRIAAHQSGELVHERLDGEDVQEGAE